MITREDRTARILQLVIPPLAAMVVGGYEIRASNGATLPYAGMTVLTGGLMSWLVAYWANINLFDDSNYQAKQKLEQLLNSHTRTIGQRLLLLGMTACMLLFAFMAIRTDF
jgi:hypothetical protein